MVQAFTIAVAVIAAVAPVLAAPAHHRAAHASAHHHHDVAKEARSIDITTGEILDARAPFSFKKAFRGIKRAASRVGGIALKAAPLLLVRDVDGSELVVRDFEEGPVGQVYIRDEDGFLYVRELDAEELSAALDAREPRFNLKRTLRKGLGAVRKGVGVAQKISGVASQFGLREFEEMELEGREFDEGLLDELD